MVDNKDWFDVRVVKRTSETNSIISLELVSIDKDLPEFTAGSHIDIELPNGLVRQYSLYNSPAERNHYLIGVLLDPNSRGGSVSVHGDISEGDVVRIRGPRNHFLLDENAHHSVLLAGGIGVTPMLCMAERLSEKGMSFEFHYCSRSESVAAFLPRVLSSAFSDKLTLHFDDQGEGQLLKMDALLASVDGRSHLYVCGPQGFMDYVLGAARAKGWPEAQIHFEYFSGVVADESGDVAFDVKIASTGQVITVPAGARVTEILQASGIDIPVSCEEGVCGTCVTRVLEGEIDHRDVYFSESEKAANDQFTPCCSRAKTPVLVLDL